MDVVLIVEAKELLAENKYDGLLEEKSFSKRA